MLDRAELLVGTQGWNYASWIGPFYPPATRPSQMLATYVRAFPTVEVDSTAYGIPTDPAVLGWRSHAPRHFRFALKLPQEITHERRLRDASLLVQRFLDRVSQLGDALGPVLVQLSPAFRPTDENRGVLREFVAGLPDGHRWAMEFRHPGWMHATTFELLKSRNVATVLVDGRWIHRDVMRDVALEPTADFAYVRWMGRDRHLTDFSRPQVDRSDDLAWWVEVIRLLENRVGRIFAYFSNFHEGHAPHSARELQRRMGLETIAPEDLPEQRELF